MRSCDVGWSEATFRVADGMIGRVAMARWVWVCALSVLAICSGCSGKSRPFAKGGPGEPGAGADAMAPASPSTEAAGAANGGEGSPVDPALTADGALLPGATGAPCALASDCAAPSQCVDGVCCSSGCTELCAACDLPGSVGTCAPAPSDAACPALACAGFDTDCRKLDPSQLSLNCQAFGQCKVDAACAVLLEPEGTPCQAGAGTCNGAGACVVSGKATLGEGCVDDTTCAEGHCVASDGGALVCCDAACDDPCEACSPAGHCEVTPAFDERCGAVACPPDDVCRDYTADVTASQCRGFAQCQTGRDCQFNPLRPEAECLCDAATGACRLQLAAACAAAGECASGVCGASAQGTLVCCASACDPGSFCSSDGARCVACEGNAIECDDNAERRCNAGEVVVTECPNGCTPGAGCNTLPPLGFPCNGGQCAAPNVCQADTTGQARCCARDCAAEGKVCSNSGGCVCQEGQVAAGSDCLLQNGDPCTSGQQCQGGSACTDGVCCQEACNGACERCEPNTGLCVAVGAAQLDP